MPADIILYALIAAGLVLWLRNILGTRHGEERDRPNPFATPLEKPAPAKAAEPIRDEPAGAMLALPETPPVLPKNFTIAPAAETGLQEIARADRAFDLTHFAAGAADAFAYVVESFADGDRETLKDLLAPSVYQSFDAALRDREVRGENVKTEIHAVRKADLIRAVLRDKMVYLSVRFTADETCVIRDKAGEIIAGDPDHVTEMIDVWTFGRALKSRDPRWLVYETSDGDISEDHKTPLPDSASI